MSLTGFIMRRSAVISTFGGMSTVAISRLVAPLRTAIAVAPTAARRSFWMRRGTSAASPPTMTRAAVSAMVNRSASQLERKLAIEGT